MLTKNLKHYLIIILPFLPAIAIAIFIIKYGVNFPFSDQWDTPGRVLIEASRGELSFQSLIDQHNESRKFFPKLLFLGLAQLTHWNTKVEMVVSWLFGLLIFANLYNLVNLTLKELSGWRKSLVLLSICLLVFSPVQFGNWLWGIQLITFVPVLCILSCISLCYSKLRIWQKFYLCGLLCSVSTFSYANGMLAWVIVYPILAISNTWRLKSLFKHYWLLFGWSVLMFANLGLYFYNYYKPRHHPSFLYALGHPLQALQYFLAFVGTPLGWGLGLNFSIFIGLFLISLFAYCNWQLYHLILSKRIDLEKTLGWQLLGIYSLLSGLITTSGRVGFGVWQATSDRYTTFSIYLAVSLVGLSSILLLHRHLYVNTTSASMQTQVKSQKYQQVFGLILLAVILTSYTDTYGDAVDWMALTKLERLNGKGCLLFINEIPDEHCLQEKVHPRADILRIKSNNFDQIEYLSPGLIDSNVMQALSATPPPDSTRKSTDYGYFELLEQQDKSAYLVQGWAVLPNRQSPADAVVLAYKEQSSNQDIGFAITAKRAIRPDIAKQLKGDQYQYAGWEKTIVASSIPESACEISAWALDANKAEVFQIAQVHNVCDISGETQQPNS